jgi:hypothetical protein
MHLWRLARRHGCPSCHQAQVAQWQAGNASALYSMALAAGLFSKKINFSHINPTMV